MFKKVYVSAVFLAVFLMSGSMLSAQEDNTLRHTFQILGSLSAGYARNSDMNSITKDDGDYYTEEYNSIVYDDTFSSDNSAADFPIGADFELRYFYSNFGIGANIGIHEVSAESEVTSPYYKDKATSSATLTVRTLVATCYYRIFSPNLKHFLILGGGLGHYSGKLKYELEDDDSLSYDFSRSFNGKQSVIGYHALAEYDFVFFRSLTLFTGFKLRYVEFDEFKNNGNVIKYKGDNFEAGLTGVIWYFGAGFSI